jgi:hypothetical protein
LRQQRRELLSVESGEGRGRNSYLQTSESEEDPSNSNSLSITYDNNVKSDSKHGKESTSDSVNANSSKDSKIILSQNSNLFFTPAVFDVHRSSRSVRHALYSFNYPEPPPSPVLVAISDSTASLINIDSQDHDILALLSGCALPMDARPYSTNYAGHQYGFFCSQLGDGRVVSLGEIVNENCIPFPKRFEITLLGSGPTRKCLLFSPPVLQ